MDVDYDFLDEDLDFSSESDAEAHMFELEEKLKKEQAEQAEKERQQAKKYYPEGSASAAGGLGHGSSSKLGPVTSNDLGLADGEFASNLFGLRTASNYTSAPAPGDSTKKAFGDLDDQFTDEEQEDGMLIDEGHGLVDEGPHAEEEVTVTKVHGKHSTMVPGILTTTTTSPGDESPGDSHSRFSTSEEEDSEQDLLLTRSIRRTSTTRNTSTKPLRSVGRSFFPLKNRGAPPPSASTVRKTGAKTTTTSINSRKTGPPSKRVDVTVKTKKRITKREKKQRQWVVKLQAGEITPETFKQWIQLSNQTKLGVANKKEGQLKPWQKELKLDHNWMMFVGGKILQVGARTTILGGCLWVGRSCR